MWDTWDEQTQQCLPKAKRNLKQVLKKGPQENIVFAQEPRGKYKAGR